MLQYTDFYKIVGSFLLLNLIVGLYSIPKATKFQAYAVGNKRFRTGTLVVTQLATVLNGAFLMQFISQTYHHGLSYIFIWLMVPCGAWLMGHIAWRMSPFMQHLSIAETMGSVYGNCARVITALVSVAFTIGLVARQINTMFLTINLYNGVIDPRIIMILVILVLTTYATLGGIYAITTTDILQFVTFMTIIMLFFKLMYLKTSKSPVEIILFLQKHKKFQLSNLLHFDKNLLRLIISMVYYCILGCYIPPAFIQRAYMASSPMQVKKVFIYSSLSDLFIIFIVILISLCVFTIHPTLPRQEVWSYITNDLSPFYKGLITISILGMAMSTADSFLHVAAVTISHDIIENIWGAKHVPDTRKLLVAKCATIMVSLLAIPPAVYPTNIFHMSTLAALFYNSFNTVVIAPFLLALFGFRGTSRTALVGMVTGVLTILIWNKWIKPKTGVDGGLVAILANGLAVMATHYLLPKSPHTGWIGLDGKQKRMQQLTSAYKKWERCNRL